MPRPYAAYIVYHLNELGLVDGWHWFYSRDSMDSAMKLDDDLNEWHQVSRSPVVLDEFLAWNLRREIKLTDDKKKISKLKNEILAMGLEPDGQDGEFFANEYQNVPEGM